ncbi:MAG: alpha/beta hydrolase [Roseiflexaceae bacterium]
MASPESERIRVTFANNQALVAAPIETQRQEWEAAVEATNLQLSALITPTNLDGVYGEWVSAGDGDEAGMLLFLHGGGYSTGSCKTHRALAAHLARAAHTRVLLIDYRRAPEHPCPAAIEDAAHAYRWLLQQGITPQQIAIGGDSAGGGLALATLLALRDNGLQGPAAAVLLSPWLDLAQRGESMHTRAQFDPLTSRNDLHKDATLYLGDLAPEDPRASPLYADLHHLPALLIHVGDHEVLLSDATRLAEKAAAAGVPVQLEIWDAMWHVWHAWADELPEARAAIAQIGGFVRQHLD